MRAKPGRRDLLFAGLAAAVGALVHLLERQVNLQQQVAAVVRDRHLVLALERLAARVGLVVPRPIARVTQQLVEILDG